MSLHGQLNQKTLIDVAVLKILHSMDHQGLSTFTVGISPGMGFI